MMPEMSYIYEKKPDPITLDVYPAEGQTSICVMYDRKTPKNSPVRQTKFKCSDDATKIEISIGESDTAYEFWVHCDKKPASVTVDAEGWYYGPGCFYGSDTISTVNIKLPKACTGGTIRVMK